MALEIFEVFRRRQRVILAWLAVLAMFLFIIGDVLIGVRMGHYGLGYGLRRLFYDTTLEELEILHDQRYVAMSFLRLARLRADAILRETKFRGTDPNKPMDENLRKEYERELRNADDTWCGYIYRGEQTSEFLRLSGLSPQQLAALGLTSYEFPLSAEGLLEFAYWKEEANRLGIVIAAEVVRQDFEKFTFGLLPESEWFLVLQQLRRAVAPETVLQWVADEIRASLAKRLVEGPNMTRTVPLTPLDLWQAYRQLRTVLPQVAVVSLDIREERFIKKVPEPDEPQLRAYFDQYKQQEPDPMRPTPGFRVPNRYRVEFTYADFRYDPKDPARTGEAWAAYRQSVEALLTLGAALRLTPAVSPAGDFLPAFAVTGTNVAARAYHLYLSHQWERYRIAEYLASFALTNTPPDQPVHHHGILPPGTGPWYIPGAAEAELAMQVVIQGLQTTAALPAVSMPASALVRPVSVRASLAYAKAVELTATLGRMVGMTLALAAPGLASGQPSPTLTPTDAEALAATSLVAQLASPTFPAPMMQAWRDALRPVVQAAWLAPGFEGLALAIWSPPVTVPFQAVAAELELEYLRSEIERFVQADLTALKDALLTYRNEYQKAQAAWRKTPRKGTAAFVPPPFSRTGEPIERYLERFCQPRGLRYFPMKQLRSRYELLPRYSGELGKILYPLYQEARMLPPATQPAEVWKRELEFADALITGQQFLVQPDAQPEALKSDSSYSVYEPRFLIPRQRPEHRALVWKAEEAPGYVPNFEEAREQVRQVWLVEKARELARRHAEQLAERIHQLRRQRQAPLDDIFRELKGDPDLVELTKLELVELRRYQSLPIALPVTGLEKTVPGPQLEPVRYPPVVDYPAADFLERAYEHLREPGDVWITTNLPADKVYVLVLMQPRREPTPLEFELDYLKRPAESRIRVERQPLDDWLRFRRADELRQQFHRFLRNRYGLDDEKYRQLEDLTRRAYR